MRRPFLSAAWRHLAMLNFEIDPAVLRPLVPRGTELDQWQGRSFVSVVGFLFLQTRLLGIPIPLHRSFPEVNLRFYVRRRHADGWRRGVVFIKEVVPRRAVALVARRVYNENYVACPMRSAVRLPDAAGTPGLVEYTWTSDGHVSAVRAEFAGLPGPVAAGSPEEFITEHYWGYVRQRDGSCLEYEVAHPRWQVWQATSAALDCDVKGFYGAPYQAALSAPPASAFVADGSAVTVYRGERIPP
jgi:uncharacterized protein YqjF (DUF2071 family)